MSRCAGTGYHLAGMDTGRHGYSGAGALARVCHYLAGMDTERVHLNGCAYHLAGTDTPFRRHGYSAERVHLNGYGYSAERVLERLRLPLAGTDAVLSGCA